MRRGGEEGLFGGREGARVEDKEWDAEKGRRVGKHPAELATA